VQLDLFYGTTVTLDSLYIHSIAFRDTAYVTFFLRQSEGNMTIFYFARFGSDVLIEWTPGY
jgi:hypothetical protein